MVLLWPDLQGALCHSQTRSQDSLHWYSAAHAVQLWVFVKPAGRRTTAAEWKECRASRHLLMDTGHQWHLSGAAWQVLVKLICVCAGLKWKSSTREFTLQILLFFVCQRSRQSFVVLPLLPTGRPTCHLCLAESFVWAAPPDWQGKNVSENNNNVILHISPIWNTSCPRVVLQVRVATEGINGTVGGTTVATDFYIEAMCSHPLLQMDKEDFKVS